MPTPPPSKSDSKSKKAERPLPPPISLEAEGFTRIMAPPESAGPVLLYLWEPADDEDQTPLEDKIVSGLRGPGGCTLILMLTHR
jgi:hypothetical protein